MIDTHNNEDACLKQIFKIAVSFREVKFFNHMIRIQK